MRVHALKSEPAFLYGDWETTAKHPKEYWVDILSNPDKQVFGLLNGNKMIGITAVFPYWEDNTGTVGYLCWTYFLPKFRGSGGHKLLHKARVNWAKNTGKYKSFCTSCRQNNIAIKTNLIKLGFKYSHSFETDFPDGERDIEFFYTLDLDNYNG